MQLTYKQFELGVDNQAPIDISGKSNLSDDGDDDGDDDDDDDDGDDGDDDDSDDDNDYEGCA